MESDTTITTVVYCEILKELRKSIKSWQRGLLTQGVVFLLGSTRLHTAAHASALLDQFKLEVFNYPPYSLPSDYHLFTNIKAWHATQHFVTNERWLMNEVNFWLSSLEEEFSMREYKIMYLSKTGVYCVGSDYVEKAYSYVRRLKLLYIIQLFYFIIQFIFYIYWFHLLSKRELVSEQLLC